MTTVVRYDITIAPDLQPATRKSLSARRTGGIATDAYHERYSLNHERFSSLTVYFSPSSRPAVQDNSHTGWQDWD